MSNSELKTLMPGELSLTVGGTANRLYKPSAANTMKTGVENSQKHKTKSTL